MTSLREAEAEYREAKRRAMGWTTLRLKEAERRLRKRGEWTQLEAARLKAYRWVLEKRGVKVADLPEVAA